MKSWFRKFKISAALDAKPISEGETKSEAMPSRELSRFETTLRQLDLELKKSSPANSAPNDLHASIMRRVRNAGVVQKEYPNPGQMEWRWVIAAGLAILVVGGIWLGRPEKNSGFSLPASGDSVRTLMAAASTFEMTRAAVETAPSSALEPLESEIALLRSDARQAMDLVLAALPPDALAFAWPAENK